MYNVIFLNVGDTNPPVVQPSPDASLQQCHYCKFAIYCMAAKLTSLLLSHYYCICFSS